MKYNIQINQEVLSETNLDIIDGAILDYLYVYCSSPNKKIDKQRIKDDDGDWTWINYQTLLKDMPLLKIKSSGALTPRIKRIEAAGYIETYRKGNQKLFIRLTEKIDELFIKKNRSIHENEQLSSKSYSPKRTNNNTKIDNTTKDNILSQSATVFNLEEEIKKLKTDQRRHIQIVGLWIEIKGLRPDNKEQFDSIKKRSMRPAVLLKGYRDEDIKETLEHTKKIEYLTKIELETIAKFIDEVVAGKKKEEKKEYRINGRLVIGRREVRKFDDDNRPYLTTVPIFEDK